MFETDKGRAPSLSKHWVHVVHDPAGPVGHEADQAFVLAQL